MLAPVAGHGAYEWRPSRQSHQALVRLRRCVPLPNDGVGLLLPTIGACYLTFGQKVQKALNRPIEMIASSLATQLLAESGSTGAAGAAASWKPEWILAELV